MLTSKSNESVQNAVFAACKVLWRSDEWPRLHHLVRSLHSVSEEDIHTPRDRSWVGNAAAKIAPRAQVLAYLLVDREYANLRQGPFDEPVSPSSSAPLSNEERSCLWAYHHQIAELNASCLAPLIGKYPNLWSLTNPLGGYIFETPEENGAEKIFPSECLERVVQAFQQHLGFDHLNHDNPKVLASLKDEFYNQAMIPLWMRFQRVGPLVSPLEITDLFFATPPDDPRRIVIRRVIALLTLRLSLLNINQVLFQALHSQKLAMFTPDNLVDIESDISHLTGRGLALTFVMGPETDGLSYGDFVGFRIPRDEEAHSTFATVYWNGRIMVRDAGWLGQAKLWSVDEFFNPHSSLLKNF